MRLTKNGETITLSNENHISAFLSNGWVEAKASALPEEKKAEVVEEVVEKPKTARKKQEK